MSGSFHCRVLVPKIEMIQVPMKPDQSKGCRVLIRTETLLFVCRLIITGTSALRDGTGASLVFIDPARQEIVRRIAMPQSVVALKWHSRLNQIFVGTGRTGF